MGGHVTSIRLPSCLSVATIKVPLWLRKTNPVINWADSIFDGHYRRKFQRHFTCSGSVKTIVRVAARSAPGCDRSGWNTGAQSDNSVIARTLRCPNRCVARVDWASATRGLTVLTNIISIRLDIATKAVQSVTPPTDIPFRTHWVQRWYNLPVILGTSHYAIWK